MRDLAKNFFLLEIEAQGNLRMLQIIIAAARVRFIGAELLRTDKTYQQRSEHDNRRATTLLLDIAKLFPDHSALLL